jgi:hypothetical protein
MEKRILVSCECKGTGFITVADNGGDGVEHVECGQHQPAYKNPLTIDELLDITGKHTGISSDFFKHN